MVVSQQNLNNLFVGYSSVFKKTFDEALTDYSKIAMIVPCDTRETTYAWMGQFLNMREWIESREIQNWFHMNILL
jgi:phage major head subunit gpT-like protein